MKQIIVTGGAGFIGSHLCSRLLNEGHKVFCVDSFITGFKSNIEHLLNDTNFKLLDYDINFPLLVLTPLFKIDVDEIYNLACPASPFYYKKYPLLTYETSVLGTMNILRMAKKWNAKFLQTSSSEIYGDPLVHPQVETYNGNVDTFGDRAPYKEGKRAAETITNEYRKLYDIDAKVVRLFNVYGPNMQKDDGRVISNFIVKALCNEDLIIYGDGTQTRSFCYIEDIVEGLINIMNVQIIRPINLGNEEEISINELAEIVIKITNSKSKIVYKNKNLDECMRRKPDVTFAKNTINWKPKYRLIEGLQKTIDYFKNI